MFQSKTVSEETVVRGLRASHSQFRAFYESERPKAGAIYWTHEQGLPPGINARKTEIAPGTNLIRLRHVPPDVDDAFLIAHEIEHIIIEKQGFPRVGLLVKVPHPQAVDRNRENLASAITSMVHDLVVDSTLAKHGFKIVPRYEKETRQTRKLLQPLREPTDSLLRALWTVNYASRILDYRLVAQHGYSKPDSFAEWFDTRYPAIAGAGKEIVQTVDQIGYDSPDKMRRLFEKVLGRLKFPWLHIG